MSMWIQKDAQVSTPHQSGEATGLAEFTMQVELWMANNESKDVYIRDYITTRNIVQNVER